MSWQDELERRIEGLGEKVDEFVTEKVKEEYDDLLEDMTLYPESKPMGIHVFSCDEVVKRFDLEKVLLDWFDVEAREQTAKKSEMEAWANGLDRIAARIRKAAAEGRHADEE